MIFIFIEGGNQQPNPSIIRKGPKTLFHSFCGIMSGTPALLGLFYHRLESGADRPGLRETLCFPLVARQPGEEQHIQCDWHLCFVRILRVRHLSARHSGSASPVEAWHPQNYTIIIQSIY